jgi:hypothetical protein
MQSALRDEPTPEPQLVLSKERLVLFGERMDLAGRSEDQIACLWVLAEHAGQPVPRQTILGQGNITLDSPVNSLKSIVSRLRKQILRPLIRRYRERESGSPLTSEKDAFIIGRSKRGSSYGWGTYMLALDPGRVQIISPRPSWMKPAVPR